MIFCGKNKCYSISHSHGCLAVNNSIKPVGNSNVIFSPNIISSGGGGSCRNCVTVKSEKDVRKIANQLAVDVYRSLTAKINKNG